ncbi:hypothetical protein ZEAMMB73_Zm00001d042924 [Zea mays]|uniref:Uncharacterized protein n=1 Tax=Zea mays TaxID=4577 RepID=A0A1D6N7J4_MAIZE|nr:hypothetical protein ZEAMMB73_Zm00001d042924 [Zea mays]
MALLAPAISGEVGLRLLLAPLSSNIVMRTASCTFLAFFETGITRSNEDLYKTIWFHARKINHVSHFLNKRSDGAILGAEEGHAHGFH